MTDKVYVGIDVAKAHLDVAGVPERKTFRLTNDAAGIDELVRMLDQIPGCIVVLEATGGYERQLVIGLAEADLLPALVNPRQARDFAKATGQLAKTDRLDAESLARFGAATQVMPRALPDALGRELQAMVRRRRQLVRLLTAEKNRRRLASAYVGESIRRSIEWFESELAGLDKALADMIKASPSWQAQVRLYESVPGVGSVLSHTCLADLPELGQLTNRKISALAGVAPLNRDSGLFRGQRQVWGGRADLRSALYMAALVATRYNQAIKTFYERLIAAGKAKKLALTACMRKLLTILNAIARSQTPWQEHGAPLTA